MIGIFENWGYNDFRKSFSPFRFVFLEMEKVHSKKISLCFHLQKIILEIMNI